MSKRYVPEPGNMWFAELIAAAIRSGRQAGVPTETIVKILRRAIRFESGR